MIEQSVVILTGAGSGIGRAAATSLARRGWAVVLAGRHVDSLHETAAQIGPGAPTLVVPADVADPVQCARLVETAAARLGRIDALVNNAGYASLISLRDLTADELHRTIAVNLTGPMLLTAAAWSYLAAGCRTVGKTGEKAREKTSGKSGGKSGGESGGGIVVNVSSVASLDPFPGLRAYGAAKAALNLFTRGLADEGLRAVAILPGAVETPLLRSLFDERSLPPDQAMDPCVVAEVIAACVSGERAFDNGSQIIVTPASLRSDDVSSTSS